MKKTTRRATIHCEECVRSAFFNLRIFADACIAAGGKCFREELLKQIPAEEWILLISHELNLTGAPVALEHFAQCMLDMGKRPLILAPHDDRLRDKICVEGIPVITLPTVYTSDIVSKAANLFNLIVVNTTVGAPVIAMLNGKRTPVLWWIHEAHESYNPATLNFLPTKLENNIHVYCVGPYAAKVLKQYRPTYQCGQLLYSVPDYTKNNIKSSFSPNISEKKIVFAIVGMQELRKGQDIVVKAIKILTPEQRERCVFFFVGKKCYEPIYMDIAWAEETFPDCVHYLSELSQQELLELYKRMDCLICASRDDPMPIVVTDALALSKLVICSENTGSAALIKKYEAGIIFRNNDATELVECIIRVCNTEEKKFSSIQSSARRLFEENFSREVFCENIKKITADIRKMTNDSLLPFWGTVSVIIPTYNAGEQFSILLYRLIAQCNVSNIELIIIDSGSSDETVELAKQAGANVFEISHKEFSHSYARNLGVEYATGEYVLLMTQDALPTDRWWISGLLQPVLRGEVIAVSCKQIPRADCDLFGELSLWIHNNFLGINSSDRITSMPEKDDFDSMRKNGHLNDVTCLIQREILRRYPYCGDYAEDLNLGIQLIRDGYKLALLSSVQVIHSHTRSAIYHLKRSLVENITLKKLFPDYPADKVDEQGVSNRIITEYLILQDVIIVLNSIDMKINPKNINTFFHRIKRIFRDAANLIEGLSKERIDKKIAVALPIDSSLQVFVQEVYLWYGKDYCYDDKAMFNQLFLLETLLRFYKDKECRIMPDTVTSVCELLIRHFGQLCGSYLATYSYYHVDDVSPLNDTIDKYRTGV